MKKFLISILIIIVLICLVVKLGILDFFILEVSEQQLQEYSNFYFDQLDLEEKKIYIKIDETVKNRNEKVFLGMHNYQNITDKVEKIIQAYFYDNPECYYISNKYMISTVDLKLATYSILQLEYLTKSSEEITLKNQQLQIAIDNILKKHITDNMSDFEKELALHNALVEHVDYYKYQDIDKIPCIKHTAYGALVEKQAVCDGYSKAFKMLLEKVGVENIIIHGSTENVAHAWNLVKLDNEYYHVDVTSDKLEENNKKHVIHKYFNIDDKQIAKTHTITNQTSYPKSKGIKYEYYNIKGYNIKSGDNLYSKLNDIVSKQQKSDILELKSENKYTSRSIIDTLYDMNFNNWRLSGKTKVEYHQIQDVYVIVK